MKAGYRVLLVIGIVATGLLWTACGQDSADVSPNDTEPGSGGTHTGESMTIEGKLVEVMESWPLQLSVQTQSGRYHIQLLETTTITRKGETVEPGALRPGQEVRVEGQASGSLAMVAQAIEIVSE